MCGIGRVTRASDIGQHVDCPEKLRGMTDKTPAECEQNFAGKGYGAFKSELAEAVVEFLRPFQEKVAHIDDETLLSILKPGAEKAKTIAAETLKTVYQKMGIE